MYKLRPTQSKAMQSGDPTKPESTSAKKSVFPILPVRKKHFRQRIPIEKLVFLILPAWKKQFCRRIPAGKLLFPILLARKKQFCRQIPAETLLFRFWRKGVEGKRKIAYLYWGLAQIFLERSVGKLSWKSAWNTQICKWTVL